MEFIDYACEKILDKDWSPDAVVGHAKKHTDWKDEPMVSTKSLYNCIHQSKLIVRNIVLPMKAKLNTKTKRIRKQRQDPSKRSTARPQQVEESMATGHEAID